MLPEELEQAIKKPAKLVGLRFEPGLVGRMATDVHGSPGSLPLLEYALSQLWCGRRNGVLTSAAYDAFGGVTGAIGDKAEAVFSSFSDTEKSATRTLFGRLVRVSPADTEGTDTRQRATRYEIGEVGWRVALRLAAPGVWLLVTSRDPHTDQEMVDVAHEALIRNWKTLRNWLRDDREFLLWRQQFQVFLSIWNASETTLLPEPALDEALKWRKLMGGDLNIRERDLIARSEEARKQSHQRRLWTWRVATAAAIVAASVGLAWLAYVQTNRYQIDTILKDAPIQVMAANNDTDSQTAVSDYFQALAIYQSKEAQRTAQQITDAGWKARALASIATAQVKAGQFAEAHLTAQQITEEAGSKASALASIVTAQVKAGQFAEAQSTAQQITDGGLKGVALTSIFTAQVKAGQFAEAHLTAQQFTDAYSKAHALADIATAQADAGQFAEAQRTAQQITNEGWKAGALAYIAAAEVKTGQFAEASKTWEEAHLTAQQITDAYSKALALMFIAPAQAKAGQFAEASKTWEEAQRTAQQITDAYLKTQALASIATAQVKAGQFTEAQRTAQQIIDAGSKASELAADIARAQADAGQLAEAQRTAQQITDAGWKASALASIATAQADAGQFAEAQRTAQQITNADLKTRALASIATAQVKAGQWKAARITGESCPTMRCRLVAYAPILIEYAKSKNSKLRANLERQEQKN